MFLNSGSEAIDGALKLARRVTGRPGIIAFRGGFHGRTFGRDQRDDARTSTTGRATSRSCRASTSRHSRMAYPRVRRRRGRGVGRRAWPTCGRCSATVVAPSTVGVDPHRARPGRGRLRPGAGRRSCAALRALLRRARDPADRRRGPVRLRPDREDVGLRARRDRPRRGRRGQGDRQRPAAVGDRVVARAAGALGPRRARLDVRRQPGRLRGGPGGPRDDRATRAWSRTPSRAARSSGRAGRASPPRTTGSATSAGWG